MRQRSAQMIDRQRGIPSPLGSRIPSAGLSTLLAVGTELVTSDEDRLICAIRDGAQDTVNQAGQQIVQRQLQVAPTLTIRPGSRSGSSSPATLYSSRQEVDHDQAETRPAARRQAREGDGGATRRFTVI